MAVAKIRKITVQNSDEFIIDPSTDTILTTEDNKDGSYTLLILTYIRKGS